MKKNRADIVHALTRCPGIYSCGARERDGAVASCRTSLITCPACSTKRKGRKVAAKARAAAAGVL